MLKRITLVLALAIVLVFAFSASAFANFGPHGGYTEDTDACAGCHRAHTSFSTVEWTDVYGGTGSALLIGSAESMTEFCVACHGDDAPGASTNVISGVFDSGPSGEDGDLVGGDNGGVAVLYETNSSFDATLNGGGFTAMPVNAAASVFEPVSSIHGMEAAAQPLWGDGNVVPTYALLNCASCHDVHGSSNYRLLKDSVNGNTVGGYDNAGNPLPFVISAEENYPASGWFKHENGQAQMTSYKPNYTSPEYRNRTTAARENMSGWCAGCHERYIARNDANAVAEWGGAARGQFDDITLNTYSYGTYLQNTAATATVGIEVFHRHPNNVSLAGGDPNNLYWLNTPVTTDTVLPLEWDGSGSAAQFRNGEWDYTDYLGCLTCHRAHGTSTGMTGWADATLETTDGANWYPQLSPAAPHGVDPTDDSALLRADNRGVCERCHNK